MRSWEVRAGWIPRQRGGSRAEKECPRPESERGVIRCRMLNERITENLAIALNSGSVRRKASKKTRDALRQEADDDLQKEAETRGLGETRILSTKTRRGGEGQSKNFQHNDAARTGTKRKTDKRGDALLGKALCRGGKGVGEF